VKNGIFDGRDLPVFQEGRVTVSTIKSAKGYTAHVCHLVYLHSFEKENMTKEEIQQMRTQIHVACTRSSLYLDLWGTHCSLINEARQIRSIVA
jgi:superfamily I DNA and RNA helicase